MAKSTFKKEEKKEVNMAKSAFKKEEKKPSYLEGYATDDIQVRVYPKEGEKRLSASLTIEAGGGHIVVYGNAVSSKNGWFFAYPQYKAKNGEYKNLVFSLEREVNDAISEQLNTLLDE